MRTKHKIEYGLLRVVIFFINLLPIQIILFLCSTLGYLAWIFFPFRLKVAYKNLSYIFPEYSHKKKLRLLRRVYLQFTRTFGLIFILHRKKQITLIENAEISGRQEIEEALQEGRGVILTTIHASWFEAYFTWFNLSGLPTTLIYQPQKNPLADDYFLQQRNRYGTSLNHLTSHERMKTYEQALKDNTLLIISLDQNYTDNGTQVKFFNHDLSCARGTSILRLRTKAPIFTSVYYMKDGKLHIDFEKVELPQYSETSEENINEIASICIKKYEPFVRSYTEQWFSLFHRLWSKKGYEDVPRSFRDIFF